MIEKEENGLRWLEFELLADIKGLTHRIFTRRGGASKAPYDSLNFSSHVGDCPHAVARNHEIAKNNLSVKCLISPLITHGDQIIPVTTPDQRITQACDGLITNILNVGLIATHADCQAAIFYDPDSHTLATVHCGWKSSILNIYANTVKLMQQQYGCKPQNLLVGISPSLGPESAQFTHYKTEIPKKYWSFQPRPQYFDFWEISRYQLLEAGVLDHHIEIAKIDTYTHSKDFFSYRRAKFSGRNATIAALV